MYADVLVAPLGGTQTLTQSYLISVVSSFFDTTVLLAAFGATAVVSLSLMLFACQVL